MKIRKYIVNLTILLLSASVGLVAAEFGARLFLNRSDYLGVGMVNDPVLGAVPDPTAKAGFDELGFRNRIVPESADIVAVGDSHTFGNTATMEDSWPYVLSKLTRRTVYNMGMGGYGPNQYFYLSQTKAFSLKPKLILWGLYMGDDFENAYSITYGLDHWAYLREKPVEHVNFNIWEKPASPNWHKKIRIWLSEHSILYQLAFHAALGGTLQGEAQIRNATRLYPGVATALSVPSDHILEAFRPQSMLTRLDQQSPAVLEGMRITFKLIHDMNEICARNHVQFVVVVIPIKEEVFSEYLVRDANLPLRDVIGQLLKNDRVAREKTFKFLMDSGISYVDPLPDLQNAVQQELYTRTATDMHPGKNGYRVIAQAIYKNVFESQAECLWRNSSE
jgi:hypothetical protein